MSLPPGAIAVTLPGGGTEILPEEVRALVGWPKGAGLTPGAYQRPVAPELEPVARRSSKSAR